MATATAAPPYGGSFLLESPHSNFTPEDFTDEHRAIAKTSAEFWNKEVAPNLDAILRQDHAALVRVLRKSAELGLVAVMVPEAYGGIEMDLISALVVAEGVA